MDTMTERENERVSAGSRPECWKPCAATDPGDASFQFTLIITSWEWGMGCLKHNSRRCVCDREGVCSMFKEADDTFVRTEAQIVREQNRKRQKAWKDGEQEET